MSLTPEQEKHAKSLFATYDKDKSGWLNEREMRLLVSVILQKSIVNPDVEKVVKAQFAKHDANNDKKISLEEFSSFYNEYVFCLVHGPCYMLVVIRHFSSFSAASCDTDTSKIRSSLYQSILVYHQPCQVHQASSVPSWTLNLTLPSHCLTSTTLIKVVSSIFKSSSNYYKNSSQRKRRATIHGLSKPNWPLKRQTRIRMAKWNSENLLTIIVKPCPFTMHIKKTLRIVSVSL